jgi:hypothetical protein
LAIAPALTAGGGLSEIVGAGNHTSTKPVTIPVT